MLFFIKIVNGEKNQITNDNYEYYQPTFNSDGNMIIFISGEHKDYRIWLMDVNGNDRKQIYNDSSRIDSATFFPSGNQLIFSNKDGIWKMDIDGSNKTFLWKGHSSRITPDEQRMVFVEYAGISGMGEDYFINIVDMDDPENKTSLYWVDFFNFIELNSDGKKVMSFKPWDKINRINIIDIDTMNIITLRENLYNISNPNFYPIQDKIVYVKDGDLWLMDIDGANQTLILDEEKPIRYPSFSPDGRKVTYIMEGDIWIMDGGTIDTDRDKIIDYFDHDDDNDGYNDTIELAEGTDPLNKNSMPPDLDKDYIPDSIDPDIDGDGILNEDDDYPYTPMKLRKEDSDLIPILIVASIYSIILIIIIVIMLRKYSRNRKQF